MTDYCYVENGTIVEGPKALPRAWRNVSGLDGLDDASLVNYGWLPVVKAGFEPYDAATQTRSGPVFTLLPQSVVAAYTVTDKTQGEIDAEKDAEADNAIASKVTMVEIAVLFDHENRLRALEGQPALTKAQFRTTLKAIYKGL